MKSPCFTVVMPVYNRENHLEKSINSVLNQTISDLELIVVDDRSSDNSFYIAKEISEKDRRVTIIKNKHKKGVSGARNTAIDIMKGKYLAFLDSDDEWDSSFLECMYKMLNETSCDVGISLWKESLCSGEVFNVYSSDFARKKYDKAMQAIQPEKKGMYYIFNNNLYEYVLKESFYFGHINTTVLKTEQISKAGNFDETLRTNEDIDFITRLLQVSKVSFSASYLYIHEQGDDNLYNFEERSEDNYLKIAKNGKAISKFNKSDRSKIKMYKKRIKLIKKSSDLKDKKACLLHCRDRIGRKYFTLGLINQFEHKLFSVFCIFMSLFYDCHIIRIKVLLSILNPFSKVNYDISKSELYLS